MTRLPVVAAALVLCLPIAAHAGQPKMQQALAALQNARAKLSQAEHDKGGHRVRALQLIDQAIAETQAGIIAGR